MTRRSLAVLALPFAAITAFVLITVGSGWVGSWQATIDVVVGSTVLTGPVVAAVAAWLMAGEVKLEPVTRVAPRGPAVPRRVFAQVWLVTGSLYLLAAAIALALTLSQPHGGEFQGWVVVVGLGVLGIGSAAGVAAGALFPFRVTVLLVGPVLFLAGTFGPSPLRAVLRFGPATGSLAGLQFDSGHALRLLGMAAGLIMVGVAVAIGGRLQHVGFAALRWRIGVVVVLVVGLVGTVTAAAAGGLISGRDGDRLTRSGERASACSGRSPAICVAPSEQRLLPRLDAQLRPWARELSRVAVLPARYQVALPGVRPPQSSGLIRSSLLQSEERGRAAAQSVVMLASCPAFFDPTTPPPDRVFAVQALLTEWLVVRRGGRAEPWSAGSAAWLRRPDAPAALQWVRETSSQLRSCQLDRVRLPSTGVR